MPFGRCPRCQHVSYEQLRTHVYCVNCNYSPDLERGYEAAIPAWAAAIADVVQPAPVTLSQPLRMELGLSLSGAA